MSTVAALFWMVLAFFGVFLSYIGRFFAQSEFERDVAIVMLWVSGCLSVSFFLILVGWY